MTDCESKFAKYKHLSLKEIDTLLIKLEYSTIEEDKHEAVVLRLYSDFLRVDGDPLINCLYHCEVS